MAKKKTSSSSAKDKKQGGDSPREDRVMNVVAKPTLSAHVPTAPKKVKPQYASFRSSRKSLVNPRRVRGGVKFKLKAGETPRSWVTQRLLRVAEQGAEAEIYKDGLEYARLGQTKRLTIEETLCEGVIQGRSDKPYTTTLELSQFNAESQERVISAMADQVRYAAKLLSGELPSNIEDVFAPLGLKLFPAEPQDITPKCSCPDWSEEKPWCKHAVCLSALLAERMGDDPMIIFGLHGMPSQELIDGLRQKRAVGVQGPGPAPVLLQHVPGVSDVPSAPLDDSLGSFWEVGDELKELDTPIEPPTLNCVLLRRLGSSPFPEGRFPLIGLMATCYQLIGEHAIREDESGEE
ncbi:MAG: SWIM zinc finger family protein [Phycisphaerales bacterium]|nr:SWIM zinc finger family protein [Phycisphaerales bacterium]